MFAQLGLQASISINWEQAGHAGAYPAPHLLIRSLEGVVSQIPEVLSENGLFKTWTVMSG